MADIARLLQQGVDQDNLDVNNFTQEDLEKILNPDATLDANVVPETGITAQAVDDSAAIDISQIDLEDSTGITGQDLASLLDPNTELDFETVPEVDAQQDLELETDIDRQEFDRIVNEVFSEPVEEGLEGIPPAEEIPPEGVLPRNIDITKPIGLQRVFSTEELLKPPDISLLSETEVAQKFGLEENNPMIQVLTNIRNGTINPDAFTDSLRDFYEDSTIPVPEIPNLVSGGTYRYEGLNEKEQREKAIKEQERLERLEQSTSMFAPMQRLFESDSWATKLNPALITESALQGIGNLAVNIFGPDGVLRNDEWMVDPLQDLESSVLHPDWLEDYKEKIRFDGPVTPEMAKKYTAQSEAYFQEATKLNPYQAWTISKNVLDTGGRGVRQAIFGEPEVDTGHWASQLALDILTSPDTYIAYGAFRGMAKAGFTFAPRTRIFLGSLSENVSTKAVRLKRATHEALSRVMGERKSFELTKLSFPKMLREVQKMYDSPTAIRLKEKLQAISERLDDGLLLDSELAVKAPAHWRNYIVDRLDQGIPIEDILAKKDWTPTQLTRAMFTHHPADAVDILRIEDEATRAFLDGRLTQKELANTGMHLKPTKDSMQVKSIVGKETVEFFGGFGFIKPKTKDVAIYAQKGDDFLTEAANFLFPFKRWINSIRHTYPEAETIYVAMKDALRGINHESFQEQATIESILTTKNWRGAPRDMTRKEINKFVDARELYEDELLNHNFLVENDLPTEYMALQQNVNKFFDDHLARAASIGFDTTKFNIQPHRYWPHMFVGDYQLLRLDRTGAKGVKIVDLVKDQNAFEVGVGDRDYLLNMADEVMNDPTELESVGGKLVKPLLVIRARNLSLGIADLTPDMLADLRRGLSDKEIARMLGGVGEIKTKVHRSSFYDLVKKLDDQSTWSTDEIKEILRTRLTVPPPGQKQIILNHMKARRKNYTNWSKDPRLVMQVYSRALIRKQYLEKMVRPLYTILESTKLRGNNEVRKLLEERLDWIMGISSPERLPSLERTLSGVRSAQAARKLWRPSSSLANALGPYQFAYPDLGMSVLLRAEVLRKTKKGVDLLNEIQASGAVHWAGAAGGKASGAMMRQWRGAKRDIQDMKIFRGAGNSLLTIFNAVEARNRAVVPLAAYLKGTEVLKLSHKEAIRLARDADDSFNFIYNMADLPKGILMFPTLGQFQGFATNALYQYGRILGQAARHPFTKGRYGVNNFHRAIRLLGAQAVFGGIRSLPFSLRYGTLAAMTMSTFTDWEIKEQLELKDTIDDFIVENPLARGIFTYSSNLISKATSGAFPAIDLSTRIGVIGEEIPLVGGFIGRDMEAMLGVNGRDLFAVINFFSQTMLGAGPGKPLSLAGRQLLASDPAVRDIMSTIIGFRNGGVQYDYGRNENVMMNLKRQEMHAMSWSFPSLRKNMETDRFYVDETQEKKRKEARVNYVQHFLVEINKGIRGKPMDFVKLSGHIQEAVDMGINMETFTKSLTDAQLKKIVPRLMVRMEDAPKALQDKYQLYHSRVLKYFPDAPHAPVIPGTKMPLIPEGSNVYLEELLESLKKRLEGLGLEE